MMRRLRPMQYHTGQTVITAKPISCEAIKIPENKEITITSVDRLFRCYDIEYNGVIVTDCDESDFKPKE